MESGTARKRKHIHVMTDFELKMLDARRHLGVEDHVRKMRRALAALAAACDETLPCGVCLESVGNGRMATLPCGHAVCLECIPHLLASYLKGVPRVSRIPCPGAKAGGGAPCHATLPVPMLLAKIPPGPVARDLCVAYEYTLHEEVIRDAVRAQIPDALGHPTLVEYRCCLRGCQWLHLLVRNEARGMDLLVVCERCAMTQCTGCQQLVSTGVVEFEAPEDLHKAACRGPLHRPVAVRADVGDLSAVRRLSHLTAEQQNHAWCAINRIVETGLAGTKCPSCDRLVSKDTNCTHLTCNAVGPSPGCGASFCFCCGGRFARNGKEYVQGLQDDDTHPRLALMHYNFSPTLHAIPSLELPRLNPPDPPADDTLVNGTEVHLPPFFHNDGWGHVFHPDVATPAGRCPTTLGSLLNQYPWFTPPPGQAQRFSSAEAEHWVTQRWSELKVLRGLYAWSQEHRVRKTVLRQLLAHPRCLASNMEFVHQWVAQGAEKAAVLPPTAMLAYEQVACAPQPTYPLPAASAVRKQREASLWAKNNLAWQRWVLCGALSAQSPSDASSPAVPAVRRTIIVLE